MPILCNRSRFLSISDATLLEEQRLKNLLHQPEITANWQTSAHSPQPAHRSSFTCATYPDDAIIGVPLRRASIAPQQQEQQLQMA